MSPTVSVVVPVYNVERYVARAIHSVLNQTFPDFELIIVDDGSTDNSITLCRRITDDRIRIISQPNRGLAGARNTGIAAARGEFVALLDSDDAMKLEKLERHVIHFHTCPEVGVSYAGADLINDDDQLLGIRQRPKLGLVTARDVFCGRVILNGSIPVFRRETLDDASFEAPDGSRRWYFDERFRRSEDVEFWTRVALLTNWRFGGLPGIYTEYRINRSGLSADIEKQLESWEAVYAKIQSYAPAFIARHGGEARARELRYLARRCFQMRARRLGLKMIAEALRTWPALAVVEPIKTSSTLIACAAQRFLHAPSLEALLQIIRPALK